MNKKLFITEKVDEGWYLSFGKPEFQGGDTIKIDLDTVETLNSLKKVLDFVERYNKNDDESDVADAVMMLARLI